MNKILDYFFDSYEEYELHKNIIKKLAILGISTMFLVSLIIK